MENATVTKLCMCPECGGASLLCPHGTTTLPLYTAPPEPVNQQLLAALKACDEAMSYMSEYDIPITLPDMVRSAIAIAIAAAEVAQPAVLQQTVSVTDERAAFEAWLQEGIDATDTVRPSDDKVEAYFATWLARAQQPSSAKPVAVPEDEQEDLARYEFELAMNYGVSLDNFQRLAEAASRAMLSVAQKPVAVPELHKVRRAEDGRPKANYDEGFDHGWNDCVYEMRALLSAAHKPEGV